MVGRGEIGGWAEAGEVAAVQPVASAGAATAQSCRKRRRVSFTSVRMGRNPMRGEPNARAEANENAL
jgi:hypothetical protein